ncbi:hypothetical protein G9A89_002949 [Geosiphon pyriformis]|nr:hypothetical protein G9A89_002949 [Geosiphon pyriformis]
MKPTPWERLLLNSHGSSTPLDATGSQLYKQWEDRLKKSPSLPQKFLREYRMLQELVNTIGNGPLKLWSLRESWEMVFTTKCGESTPCGTCRDCSIRIAQAAIVIFAAQGVADENILPHLGAVFRSPRYSPLGIEEWVMLPIAEVATVLNHCSMQGQNALYIHDFLAEIAKNGVPRTLEDCLTFYGMLKKSACLFLGVVFHQTFGIPVDRHLSAAFVNCGWVHPKCVRKSDATILSYMVELWLPVEETSNINNVVAGIRQLYQNSKYTDKVASVASRLGPAYSILLSKLTKDLGSVQP